MDDSSLKKINQKKIKIIGGGFSGLSLAYYLSRANLYDNQLSIEIIEEQDSLGGLIRTDQLEWGIAEYAANGLLNSEDVEALFEDLKIDFLPQNKEFKRKFVYRQGLKRWPLGFTETIGLLLCLLKNFYFGNKKWHPNSQESIYDWGIRCLSRPTTEYLLLPALQGVYSGDPKELSATLILQRFIGKEKRAKVKQKLKVRGTVVPLGGMGELIKSLEKKVRESGVIVTKNKRFSFKDVNRDQNMEDLYVLTVPAYKASGLLKEIGDSRVTILAKIDYMPLTTVTTFKKKGVRHQIGFGGLFPKDQGFHALGVLFNEGLYGPFNNKNNDVVSERWILPGTSKEKCLEFVKRDHLKLYGEELEERSNLLGSHFQVWQEASPYYNIYLEEHLSSLRKEQNNIVCFGNYMGALGLGQILKASKQLSSIIIEKHLGKEER